MNSHKKIIVLLIWTTLLFACTARNNKHSQSDSTNIIETDTVAIPDSVIRDEGVVMFKEKDIRATGNEPFWLLELINDSVHFKLIGGFEFRELLPAPTMNTKDSLQYDFQTGPATVSVVVQSKACIDGMSGFQSPFTVDIKFKGPDNTQSYHGCGDYLSAFKKVREPENP